MPLNIRFDGDIVVLSNIGRLMNDPRYVDAERDVGEMLDQGYRKFILELGGVRDAGSSLLGMLMTLTRKIRRRDGELVLTNVGRGLEEFIASMQMDAFWDIFDSVGDARHFFLRSNDAGRDA